MQQDSPNRSAAPDRLRMHIGGMSGKRSGIGRLGGAHTLKEMTDLKTICLDVG